MLRFAAILVIPLTLASCGGGGGGTTEPDNSVATVSISPGSATLVPQQTVQLTATARNSTGGVLAGKSISWTSEAGAVASVTGGLVTGLSPGSATIRATSESVSETAQITVVDGGLVGPAGGTIVAAGGVVTLLVPVGAVTQNTAITVNALSNPPMGLANLVPGTAFTLGPGGTNFAQPVTVRLQYEIASLPQGVQAANLIVYRHNGTNWVALDVPVVDQGTRLVSGETSQFSPFALAPAPVDNPVPAIANLNPSVSTAGDPSFDLVVTGTDFASGAEVRWNGTMRQTTFNSATQLTAEIPAGDVAAPGQANVTVINPAPGGGTSNTSVFTVVAPAGPGITVTTLTDGTGGGVAGECSLRSAIMAANTNSPVDACQAGSGGSPDAISFAPGLNGTITLGSHLELISESLEIDGDNRIQINGASQYVPIESFGDLSLTIANLVIRDGHSPGSSGGIAFGGRNLTLTNVTVAGNTATGSGGGLSIFAPQAGVAQVVNISNSTISQNMAGVKGGGIVIAPGYPGFPPSVNIVDSEISQNSVTGPGGGIYNEGGILSITKTTIRDNVATSGGGMYMFRNTATTTIDRSVVRMNTAAFQGGGLFVWDHVVQASNSTISYNTAHGDLGTAGGGIAFQENSIVTLINSTVAMNAAPGGGAGGIERLTVLGGSPAVHFTNTIVGPQNAGPNCVGGPAGFTSHDHNLETASTCNFLLGNDIMNGLSALGPLQDNGGPTWTHAPLPASQAIDAGDNATCAADPINGADQRETPRNDGMCDIGAYEVLAPPG